MSQPTPEQYLKYANFFFYTIGMDFSGGSTSTKKWKTFLMNSLFFLIMFNIVIAIYGEFAHMIHGLGATETALGGIMTMAYLGFGALAVSKMVYVFWKRDGINKCIREMEEIFPYSIAKQQEYQLEKYLNKFTKISFGFSVLYMVMIWVYNMYDIVNYLIFNRLLHISKGAKVLNYNVMVPWDYTDHWSFYALYLSLVFSGYTSAAVQLSCDLLIFAIASQLVMHYDHISRSIENYVIRNKVENDSKGEWRDDMKFIGSMVDYHEKVLRLSDNMNNIFGVPLVINFFSTALVMCVLGFHMTVGMTQDQMVKLPLFLSIILTEIFLFSIYGQELMEASENIADAVYNHNWSNADLHYKKMLVLIAQRAQRPAQMKATFFLDVSLMTMTDVIQLSYKFFTLLRTMYSN